MLNSSWTKAEKSTGAGNCVEVAWRKASASSYDFQCVEASPDHAMILVRDSKDPDGPILHFTRDEWAAFQDGVRKGEFDLP